VNSHLYHDSEEQQRLYSRLLDHALEAIDSYSTDKDEKNLKLSVTALIEELFEQTNPVINVAMLNGEKLEPILSSLTKIEAHEFAALRTSLNGIVENQRTLCGKNNNLQVVYSQEDEDNTDPIVE
jgi:hypothetical protein